MFAHFRKKQVNQKKDILEGIFAQNLRLVGKTPVEKNSFMSMKWSLRLGLLLFLGLFLSTLTVASRIPQSRDMFNRMPIESAPAIDAHSPVVESAGNPARDATPGLDDKKQMQHYSSSTSQSLEDKKHVQEFVNLISQSLADKKQVQEYANSLNQSLEEKEHMQDDVNLISQSQVPIKKMFGLSVKTIIIDAGHGGEDPGAIGGMGTKEKDITIDIAHMLKTRLEARGSYRVLLTRQADRFVSLKARTVIANTSGADLFISVHVNFVPKSSLDLVETYYFGPSKSDISMKLAEKENEGSDFSINDYNQIIKKLSNTMKLQESRLFAQSIQQHLYKSMRAVSGEVMDYGVKRAPFVVLLAADMPGVLVEVACLSNRDQEQRLRDHSYREDIAKYIETGVIQYLDTRSTGHDTERADRGIERNAFRRN